MNKVRIEKDALGKVKLPEDAYFGAQTQRAIENFPISGLKPHREYIYSVVLIKKSAAIVNNKLGLLDQKKAQAVLRACDEILSGKFRDQFMVDPYQAGAGTSHNMNANEVIANRANEILGFPRRGSYKLIHPNDHVNMSQSTNDVIPTAIRIAVLFCVSDLLKNIKIMENYMSLKAKQYSKVVKAGRTHLQDASPITFGQEFSGYKSAITNDRKRIEKSAVNLRHVGIGGTAVGTGINTHPQYQQLMIAELKKQTNLPIVSAENLFESMQNTADFLDFSSSLRTLSQNLIRIGNDLRLLSSGPGTGLNEIKLPYTQPGSSIMPGKVNPSIIEMLTMVCYQVIGMDLAILLASQAGQLELNVMLPLIAFNLLEQTKLLTHAIGAFNEKCLKNMTVNERLSKFWLERSTGLGALLNPYIGYEKATELVKISLKTNKSIKELAIEKKLLTPKQASEIFLLVNLTKPNINS